MPGSQDEYLNGLLIMAESLETRTLTFTRSFVQLVTFLGYMLLEKVKAFLINVIMFMLLAL